MAKEKLKMLLGALAMSVAFSVCAPLAVHAYDDSSKEAEAIAAKEEAERRQREIEEEEERRRLALLLLELEKKEAAERRKRQEEQDREEERIRQEYEERERQEEKERREREEAQYREDERIRKELEERERKLREECEKRWCKKHHKHCDHDHSDDGYVGVTGITANTSGLTIIKGLSAKIYPTVLPSNASNKAVSYSSNNLYVAGVDSNGTVYGLNVGVALITIKAADNGLTTSVYVGVIDPLMNNPGQLTEQVSISASRNPTFLYVTANSILLAPPCGIVPLTAVMPMSFDANIINALAIRPDVTIVASFPYNNHMVLMTVPAGYNLSRYLKDGYVEWTDLMNKKGITVSYLN